MLISRVSRRLDSQRSWPIVNGELERLVRAQAGVITRVEALAVVSLNALEHTLRSRQLMVVHRGVYACEPITADRRRRAALKYCRRPAALSHATALAVWQLVDEDHGPIHVTTAPGRRITAPGLIAHRSTTLTQALVRRRQGMPVTMLERSLVDSWPLLPADERRRPVIQAVTTRRTTPARIRPLLDDCPRLADRATFKHLLQLLEIGCHSPLEMWGFEHIFSGPGMPQFRRQVRMRLDDRTAYLDVYAEDEMVNFELDGRGGHLSAADRERDLKRDAALAALGILVVRFTHYRLTHEPEAVRREILAILAARRGYARSLSL
jgi:very-short-patch-repair endonuclease